MIAPDYGENSEDLACGATFSYFIPLPNNLSKPIVLKNVVAKEGLPRDDPSGLGAEGPRFKSGRPDQTAVHFKSVGGKQAG
jgi:hypothetical protein